MRDCVGGRGFGRMIEQSFAGLQICGGGRFYVDGSIGRPCKSVPVAREAGAIARTLDTNNPDHAIRAFRGYSHAAVAKGEIERVDGGLIAKGGKRGCGEAETVAKRASPL